MAQLNRLDGDREARHGSFCRLAESANSSYRLRWRVLALLAAACFVPRLVAGWRWDIIWGDTLCYLAAAEALEAGNLELAFKDFGLNVYPAILCLIRKVADDWQTAAKWFSVAAAVLTVLPLFGWLRRQFDDRLAIIGCLCYAFHGKLVAVSPLAIRDPVFWLFVAAAMYWAWRAAAEVRLAAFAAAGAAFTLAVHTRTEGWLLLAPMVLWPALRFATAGTARLRLAAGTALCLAVMPATVTSLNLTVLRSCPQWQIIPARHVALARDWATARTAAQPVASGTEAPAENSRLAAAQQWLAVRLHLARQILVRAVKGFTYVGTFLTLCGVLSYRRLTSKPENLPIWLMCLGLTAMIWVRYQRAGLDIRYFLPMVILLTGWMALGYNWLERVVLRRLLLLRPQALLSVQTDHRPSPAVWRKTAALGALAAVLITGSLAEAKLPAAKIMRRQIVLGQWIAEVLGPNQRIAGGPENLVLLSWYAKGTVVLHFDPIRLADEDNALADLQRAQPDVVVLLVAESNAASCRAIVSRLADAPDALYRAVAPSHLPLVPQGACVLLRAEKFGLVERERRSDNRSAP